MLKFLALQQAGGQEGNVHSSNVVFGKVIHLQHGVHPGQNGKRESEGRFLSRSSRNQQERMAKMGRKIRHVRMEPTENPEGLSRRWGGSSELCEVTTQRGLGGSSGCSAPTPTPGAGNAP